MMLSSEPDVFADKFLKPMYESKTIAFHERWQMIVILIPFQVKLSQILFI